MAAGEEQEARRIPLTRMRRAIARTMSASALVPQFTVERDLDGRPLAAVRARLKADGSPVGYTDFLVAACAACLVEHPRLNASFDDDAIVEHAEVNVGIAVALDDGLIAPAVRAAHRLPLAAIAAERERLTAGAQAGTLAAQDVLSTTFTTSNLGTYGVRRFRALVVPPQAAILAVGAAGPAGDICLALSCDHRVVDGAPAARFLGDVVARLEDAAWLAARLEGVGVT